MTVKELITNLLEFDMNEEVEVCLDDTDKTNIKVTSVNFIENWHGTPTIHFTDWRKKE